MKTATKYGAILTLTAGLVAGFEGLRQYAYKDPVGIPTICFGHTKGVKMGDFKTKEECKQLLQEDLVIYAAGLEKCIKVKMPPERWAALISFSYNVGVPTACKSSVVGLINQGKTKDGCNRLLLYNKAFHPSKGLIPLPGLTKRRAVERDYCMKGA